LDVAIQQASGVLCLVGGVEFSGGATRRGGLLTAGRL
jgi:hypothetical protein